MSELEAAVGRILRQANANFDRAIAELQPNMPAPLPAPLTQMEAWGRLARAFNDAFESIGQQFQKGYTAIDRGGN